MIVIAQPNATEEQIQRIVTRVREFGLEAQISRGASRVIIGVIGPEALLREKAIAAMRGVEAIVPVLKPYKLAARDSRGASSVPIGDVRLGEHEDVVLICGPCSVESKEQILSIATIVKESGARILRGGAFKPRTSPYSFQGLREEGLRFLAEARAETGLPVVTEVMDPRDLPMIEKYADCLQVGTRNMHNFSLLKEVGRSSLPVLLKRGFSATIYDLIMSAEYILNEGNPNVVLCERGIRTFDNCCALHARFERRSHFEIKNAFAGDRRPNARSRSPRVRAADVSRRCRGRSGRADDRSARFAGAGQERWKPGAHAGDFRRARPPPARSRRSDRPRNVTTALRALGCQRVEDNAFHPGGSASPEDDAIMKSPKAQELRRQLQLCLIWRKVCGGKISGTFGARRSERTNRAQTRGDTTG